MSEIEQDQNYLIDSDFDDLDDAKLEFLYLENKIKNNSEIKLLNFQNWNQFVRDSQIYCLKHNIDTTLTWEALLSTEDLEIIRNENYDEQFRWDKWDYIFVGSAGIIATLTDYFFVAIPKTLTSGEYSGQQGSKITEWLHNLKLPPSLQKWLEEISKVPYDKTGGGDHRIDTFGHDPVLGFIIGTIDIMRRGATTIKGGNIVIEPGSDDPLLNPLHAIIIQFLHLVSDAATSKGLPVPFASVFRALDFGSFSRPNGEKATISQISLWMYHNGYDLRHFLTMGITPATIELILRLYLMIRHYVEHGETNFLLASHPKYRSMLLSAHAIACAGNAGKIALMQGNPLAINYVEWLALMRYLIPSIKYWLFDKSRLKLEYLEKINDDGWNELLKTGDDLLVKIYRGEMSEIPMMTLN